jgi:hypothetical protein
MSGSSLCVGADDYSQEAGCNAHSKKQQPPADAEGCCFEMDQKDASSSSMASLSTDSMTARTLVSSGSMFLAKNDADAILPS